jgi:hypothetical protein
MYAAATAAAERRGIHPENSKTRVNGTPYGSAGLEVFHFNGAAPITPFSAVLTKAPIDEIHWDNANHLYALSNSTGKRTR